MLPVIARSCRPNLVLQASRAFAVVGHAAHALSAHLGSPQSDLVCCLQTGDALPPGTRNAPDPAQQDTQAHARPSELPSDAQDAMHQAVPAPEASTAAAAASTNNTQAVPAQASDEPKQPQRRRPRLTVNAPMPRFIAPTIKLFKDQMNLETALDVVKVSMPEALTACGCSQQHVKHSRAMVSACTLSEAPPFTTHGLPLDASAE